VTTIPPEALEAEQAESASAGVGMPGAEAVVPSEESAEADQDEPPVSSSRSKVAETIDEALASAAELEEEREVPVKTPPPESGPQAAGPPPQGLESPRVPEVDGLEEDLLGAQQSGPTAEQLGDTIELEPPRGPALEIDETPTAEPQPERPPEEIEVALPRGQMPSGTYDLPPAAPAPSPPAPPVAEQAATTSSAPPEPRPTARPELGAAEIARVVLGRPTSSPSFLDVLDRSMSL
jgi:hypothetical protein